MADRIACSYALPDAPRFCRQSAKWLVEFTTPDDGVTMRGRYVTVRCKAHLGNKFLPKGATGITIYLIGDGYCDTCDGCGWVEGGRTLQTDCRECKGTGRTLGLNAIPAARAALGPSPTPKTSE